MSETNHLTGYLPMTEPKPHVPLGNGLPALDDDDWELPVCNRDQSGDTTCESCQ